MASELGEFMRVGECIQIFLQNIAGHRNDDEKECSRVRFLKTVLLVRRDFVSWKEIYLDQFWWQIQKGKLKEMLDKVVKESAIWQLTIVTIQNTWLFEKILATNGDVKIKLVQEFKFVVTENGMIERYFKK